MAEVVRQELLALAAIFCGPHEWEMLSCSETDGAVFRIHTTAEGLVGEDVPLELVFHLPAGYPSCLPSVSVSSEHLTRAQCVTMKEKEYLILQKTSKVDVDSSGKKCKEKMISVLSETKVQTGHQRFLAFEVKEYSTLEELQKEFETAGLRELFSECVLGLVK
ncbi:hypothetical protein STEG23_023872 [Scotinomys teguina]